jgi:hypothetical protein
MRLATGQSDETSQCQWPWHSHHHHPPPRRRHYRVSQLAIPKVGPIVPSAVKAEQPRWTTSGRDRIRSHSLRIRPDCLHPYLGFAVFERHHLSSGACGDGGVVWCHAVRGGR